MWVTLLFLFKKTLMHVDSIKFMIPFHMHDSTCYRHKGNPNGHNIGSRLRNGHMHDCILVKSVITIKLNFMFKAYMLSMSIVSLGNREYAHPHGHSYSIPQVQYPIQDHQSCHRTSYGQLVHVALKDGTMVALQHVGSGVVR